MLTISDLRSPGPARVTPFAAAVGAIAERHCRDLGIWHPAFDGYTTMCLYLYPRAPAQRLIPITVFHNLLFYVDELFTLPGAEAMTPATAEAASMIEEALEVFAGSDRLPGGHPVYRASQVIREMVWSQEPDPAWFDRLTTALTRHLRAATTPLQAVMTGNRIDLDKYIAVRGYDGGMYTTVEFIEFAEDYYLPDEVLSHPVVAELRDVTITIGALMNDIFSYHKEVVEGGTRFNLVHVLMENDGCSLPAAVDHAVGIVNDEVARFLRLSDQVPAFASADLDAAVARYVTALHEQNAATYHWQWSTNRYRSPNHVFAELRSQT